jgi:ATP-dependent Lon protease
LEIGGLKEKSIAGHRAGLTTIVTPRENKKDLEDIPAAVKKDIKFVFADEVTDVLRVALTKWPISLKKVQKYTPISATLIAN